MKNFRLVRKNNKREIKKKFTIRIEEHISQAFEVDAEDIGEAMQIAEDKYRTEKLSLITQMFPQD